MVPTTRRNLPRHDSGNKNKSKLQHCSQYYIAAQLEAATAHSAGGGDLKPSRRFPRLLAMAAAGDDAEGRRQGEEAAAGTSSHGGGGGKDWLQLGLATASSSASTSSSASAGADNEGPALAPAPAGGPVELDQFAGNQSTRMTMTRPPLNPLPIRSYHYQYGHGRYHPPQSASGSMPTTVPFLPFARPLRSFSGDLAMRVVGPPPPRAEAAGLWLTLQAAPNQIREPILPQIPTSYLRIRDSNMKVEVVIKYLADKLGLTQSHQVELTCRGHLLPPFLLMKYVRDCIWCGGSPAPAGEEDEEVLLPRRRSQSPAPTDHVMTLFYSTKCRDR